MARSSLMVVTATVPPPPKIATSLSINVSPSSGHVPFDVTVTSTLYDSTGNPLIGKPIIEYINTIWIGERYSGTPFTMRLTWADTFNFQTKFAGDDAYLACDSPVVPVTAMPAKIATSISAQVSPTSGAVPFTVIISGKLIDSSERVLNGKTVNMYDADNSGNPVGPVIMSTTTSDSGDYTFSVNITVAGTYRFVTEFPGDDTYLGCETVEETVGIGETQPPYALFAVLAAAVLIVGSKLKSKS